MDQWRCEQGACLMVPTGAHEHLFVVAIGPVIIEGYGSEPKVIIVNFSSVKEGLPYDTACEVLPGAHPFITKKSFIYYRNPQILSVSEVEKKVNTNQWRPKDHCSEDLLREILAGFKKSKRLPLFYNEILDAIGI